MALPLLVLLLWLCAPALAGDPFAYLAAQPLGVKQKVIGINGQFPGPPLNVTTNWNVVVNVRNNLDEPLLTWNGIQHRKNSWQDGLLATNCPIPPNWNWTYHFQVKDQIGSFFCFPSTAFQRATGGYGASSSTTATSSPFLTVTSPSSSPTGTTDPTRTSGDPSTPPRLSPFLTASSSPIILVMVHQP